MRWRLLVWTLMLGLPSAAFPADENRGSARGLYDGHPPVGVVARIGSGLSEVPASRVPCRNCHGRDGRGGVEAGSAVPPITPAALTSARLRRPAYDLALFAAAVREGRSSSGRRLDPAMPRFALDDAAITDLWASLPEREAEETTGVEAQTVRFAVASRGGVDLPALMQAAWRERGDPFLHGRRIRFERSEPARSDVLASLFDQDAPSSPAPRLFPFAFWSDGDRSDEVRGIVADRSRQVEALVERAPPGARRIAERGQISAQISALPAPSGAGGAWDDLSDVTVLSGPALVLASPAGWSTLCGRLGEGAHLFAPLHDVEPILPCLRAAGATMTVADPSPQASEDRQHPFAVRLVRTAAAILEEALVQAGRDLTRGRLMQAIGTIRRDDLPWPAIDFTRYPVSGSRSIEVRSIPPFN